MKHDQHNLGLLPNLPRLVTLSGTTALLLSSSPAGAQFTEIFPGLPEKFLPCVAVGDYDGDGDLDVLVAANGKHDIPFSIDIVDAIGLAPAGYYRASR